MADRQELPARLERIWADFARSLARRGRSDATTHVYRRSFETFWRWAIDHGVAADPAAVDHHTINEWSDELLVTPARRNDRPVLVRDPDTGEEVEKLIEPATRRVLWANLRPFFTWWVDEEGGEHPFGRADAPPTPQAEVPVARLEDLRAVLATCANRMDFTDTRDAAVIRVLLDTGARRGEVIALRVEDWQPGPDLLSLDGKTGPRVVPVSAATGEALGRYVRRRETHRHADLPALWLGPRGPLRESGISQLLARRCDLAGVARINPHKLRHTWAHMFRAEGGAEGDLLYLAGWSTTAMAHRYGRSAAAERARASARNIAVGDRL